MTARAKIIIREALISLCFVICYIIVATCILNNTNYRYFFKPILIGIGILGYIAYLLVRGIQCWDKIEKAEGDKLKIQEKEFLKKNQFKVYFVSVCIALGATLGYRLHAVGIIRTIGLAMGLIGVVLAIILFIDFKNFQKKG